MLVLGRNINESIMVGDSVEVLVVGFHNGHVRLGIMAPRELAIHRREIWEQHQRERGPAGVAVPSSPAFADAILIDATDLWFATRALDGLRCIVRRSAAEREPSQFNLIARVGACWPIGGEGRVA